MPFITRLTRSNLLALSVTLLLAELVLSGCEEDTRQLYYEEDTRKSYIEPKLPSTQLATLNGGLGCYTTDMDGDRVDSANLTFLPWGSNSLKVKSGPHEFRVLVNCNTGGRSCATRWLVRCNFEAGHTYHFDGKILAGYILTITDEQTKEQKTIRVQEDDLPRNM